MTPKGVLKVSRPLTPHMQCQENIIDQATSYNAQLDNRMGRKNWSSQIYFPKTVYGQQRKNK